MIIKIILSDPKIKQKKTKLTPPAFFKATIINKLRIESIYFITHNEKKKSIS